MTLTELTEERDHKARMCAAYTNAGLYDLAKQKAREWAELDAALHERLCAPVESESAPSRLHAVQVEP
jgi:hypothetical protein